MKRTPGPWELTDMTVYALNSECVNRFSCLVQGGFEDEERHTHPDELRANARLIAAAPDLLRALIRLCKSYPTDSDMQEAQWEGPEIEEGCRAYEAARAAVLKATGEAE